MDTTPQFPGCKTLAEADEPQIRLGIQGAPGEGKTYAALTFPKCIVANVNRGLGAHRGKADIIEVPFYNPTFIDNIQPRKPTDPPNVRDALIKWIRKYGPQMLPSQTFVVDGNSDIEQAFETQEALEPVLTDNGRIDGFAAYKHKITYFSELMTLLKTLPCHVVYICHEQDERDKRGGYTGKIKPLLSGQYADKLAKDFTDWFRQIAQDKPDDYEKVDNKTLKLWGMKTWQEFKAMADTFEGNTIYAWQTESDSLFSGKKSSLVGNTPRFIPANYASFCKWLKPTGK